MLEITYYRDAAEYLSKWLEENNPEASPKRYEAAEPTLGYRRCVGWIVNESLMEEYWEEEWFKEGIVAFTLIALEREGWISLACDEAGNVKIQLRTGKALSLDEFKSGELLAEYKYDPEFSDLDWRCVAIMAGCLDELREDQL